MTESADVARSPLLASSGIPPTAAPLAGPRPEIRFRRRVRYGAALREAWRSRELVRTLAERDLRARYKQTLLGVAWAVVTPLLLMAVFTIVFTKFTRVDPHGAPYVIFAYVGLVPWTFFSASLSAGGSSLVGNLAIVNKTYCPREVFPIAAVVVALVDTIISLFVLGVIFAVTGTVPKAQIVYAPLLIAVLLAFTVGATLIISSLLVYLRDLRHALPLLLQLGLFATPVAYGIELISKKHSTLILYSALNPLGAVIDGLRRTVLFGQQPDWATLGAGASTSLLVLVVGYWIFKRLETGIADIA